MMRLCFLILFLFGAEARAGFRRIVCLNPVLSEWVAEILGRKVALQRLVGVSEYSNHPDYLRGVPEVGPYPKLHLEKIAGLKPDLVLASEEYNLPEQVGRLKRLKLNVRSVKKESFGSMEEWIDSLGGILEEPAGAADVRNRWKSLRQA
ncbi:MAG: ABC transporter substrate-binding protein, partial [Bdellovibrionales bacterium]|nr:ABC transporter substrate-binding protein [Bdellovibrionales bacterium]